jgi:hypothetical protein
MSKKYTRSCTNTRWRNLTDNNKNPYLRQQTGDTSTTSKARIFANNKRTHEQRKGTQYTIRHTHTPASWFCQHVSTHVDNNTCACTLETYGTTFTAATNYEQRQSVHLTPFAYLSNPDPAYCQQP